MADGGNPIAGLYPQPPQPQQNALSGNPLQLLGAISQLNAQALFQKSFAAKQAVGKAAQDAILPDGSVDPNAFTSAIKANPDAAFAAPEGIQSALEMQRSQIANGTALFTQKAAQNDYVVNGLAALANKPDVSIDDVNNFVTTAARNTGIPSAILNGWRQSLPKDPAQLRTALQTFSNAAMGAGAAAQRVSGPPTAAGAPTTQPLGGANYGSGTGRPGSVATELPPGQAEAIKQNQAEFVGDQTRSAATLANVRPLQQALPLIQQLSNTNFGPGSPEWAKVRGALTTAGIINADTSDLQVRQEVGKYLLRYAKGAQDAGRSDNALSAAIGSNPNLDLTQPANLALIKNQIGMDRQDAALPLAAPPDRAKYKDFKSTYYQSTDPRAFSFDLMTPTERAALQKSLGDPKSAAYQKFVRSYAIAKQAGVLTPPAQQQQDTGQ